ncbi:12124_t:CDS:2 [Funneliformis geosporum]|uniref:12124_t:CDS:1 n=1 Tax=Funneliformis geosporum TaxID=1117311 RepID=A0A9W4SEJ8_9GLOM|nr:12124_t:CDS:2 [Funneliformis geosporum]
MSPIANTSNPYNHTINPTGISSITNGFDPAGISFGPAGNNFDPTRFSSDTAVVPSEPTIISSSSHNGVFPNPKKVSSSTVVPSGSAGLPSNKVASSSGSSGKTGNPKVESEIHNLSKGKLPEKLVHTQNTVKIQANNNLLLKQSCSKDSTNKVFATRRPNKLRKIQPKPPQGIIKLVNNSERFITKVTAPQAMKVSEQQTTKITEQPSMKVSEQQTTKITEQPSMKVTEQQVKERQHQKSETSVQESDNNENSNMRLPTIQELGVFDDGPPLYRPIATYPISMKVRQELFENMQLSQIRDVPLHYATNKTSESQSTVWTKIPRPTSPPLPSKTSISTTSPSTSSSSQTSISTTSPSTSSSSQITSLSQVGTASPLPESSFSKLNVTSTESSGKMFTSSSTSMKQKTTEPLQRGTITLPPLVLTGSYPDYSKPSKVSSELTFSISDQVIHPLQPGLNASWNRSIFPSMQTPNEPINLNDDYVTSVKPNECVNESDVTLCTDKNANVEIVHDLSQESTSTEKLATEKLRGSSSESARKSSSKKLNKKVPSSVSKSKTTFLTMSTSESESDSDHLPTQMTVEAVEEVKEVEEDNDELRDDIPEEVTSIRNSKKRYREHKNEFSTAIASSCGIKRAKKEKSEKEKREEKDEEEVVAPRRARPINDRRYQKPKKRITRNAARNAAREAALMALNPLPKPKNIWVRRGVPKNKINYKNH